jgi:hypothetical protein
LRRRAIREAMGQRSTRPDCRLAAAAVVRQVADQITDAPIILVSQGLPGTSAQLRRGE